MSDLYRFNFCPRSHYHRTAEDAAACPELVAAFGYIRNSKRKKPMHLCSVPGCDRRRLTGRQRCRECYAAQLETRRHNRSRKGDW